jgi:hypothetical protein
MRGLALIIVVVTSALGKQARNGVVNVNVTHLHGYFIPWQVPVGTGRPCW